MRSPSEILSKVVNHRLVRLAVDGGYVVEVDRNHLYGVAEDEAAVVGAQIWMDRGDDPQDAPASFWVLLTVRPRSVSFTKGMRHDLFSHDKYDSVSEMEQALLRDSFLNSVKYGGNNTEEIQTN